VKFKTFQSCIHCSTCDSSTEYVFVYLQVELYVYSDWSSYWVCCDYFDCHVSSDTSASGKR